MTVPGLKELAAGVRILALCDVDNPFIGPTGAARVFAPQKGADPQMVEVLERRMSSLASTILSQTGVDVSDLKRAGAAGGLGGALHAYLGAELVSGIDKVMDMIGFNEEVIDAEYIISGEGTSDHQTLSGKVPMGVLRRSRGVPVYLLSGRIRDHRDLIAAGFAGLFQVTPDDVPFPEAIQPEVARENLRRAAARFIREVIGG